jgi:lysophospholipase L1-like esterase
VSTESVSTVSSDVFDRIPGMFEPAQSLVDRPRRELAHRVTINSLGYRGREIGLKGDGRSIRVLCIGDSFTFGSYVNDDETLPFQLERMFEGSEYPIEVINGGVGDTTIVDQLYFLKKSRDVEVDLVILTFTENDIGDLRKAEPTYMALARNRQLKSSLLSRHVYSLVRRTALFNFALLVKATYETPQDPEMENASTAEKRQEAYAKLWKRYEELLGEMQGYLKERSVRFVFVIFPSDHRIGVIRGADGTGQKLLGRIESLTRRMGIRTINLLEPLRSSGLGRSALYLLPYDGHPSRLGYRVAAEAIARYLEDDVRDIGMRRQRNTRVPVTAAGQWTGELGRP